MKTILALVAVTGFAAVVHSQSPAPAPVKPRNAVDVLNQIKADNAKLLNRQAESLKKLGELEETAKTIKKFAARG